MIFGGLLAAILVSGAAFAEISGNELFDRCRQSPADEIVAATACIAYTEGVADAMLDNQRHAVHGFQACFPRGAGIRQFRDIVVQYLEEYPAQRHLLASSLVAKALSDAFPCQ
jgi:hypothetical protein